MQSFRPDSGCLRFCQLRGIACYPQTGRLAVLRRSGCQVAPQCDRRGRIVPQAAKEDSFGFSRNFDAEYQLEGLIGSGSFSSVQAATQRGSGQRVAVKVIRKRLVGGRLEPNFRARVQNEVDVYNHLGHSLNVASLHGAYENDSNVLLVLELCTGGDLWSRIAAGKYTERVAAHICEQMLHGIAQCHSRNILVRDIKPDNFLFLDRRDNSPLLMIDFGLACHCAPGQNLTDRAGTPIYVAPEVLKQRYGLPSDLWSVGIIAYQLLTGRLPFDDDEAREMGAAFLASHAVDRKEAFRATLSAPLDFDKAPWDAISPAARDFCMALLQRDPAARPAAADMLRHPWLASQHADERPADGGINDTLVQRLQRYGTYGKLKQAALRAVAECIRSDSNFVADLRQGFETLDPGRTGSIPYSALVDMLENGVRDESGVHRLYDLSPLEVRQLVSTFHVDDDGLVDYYEWLAATVDWHAVQECPDWAAWSEQVFRSFQRDGSGTITRTDLARLLCGDEECPVPDVIEAELREADANGDASISFEEFLALLRQGADDAHDLQLYESRLVQRA